MIVVLYVGCYLMSLLSDSQLPSWFMLPTVFIVIVIWVAIIGFMGQRIGDEYFLNEPQKIEQKAESE